MVSGTPFKVEWVGFTIMQEGTLQFTVTEALIEQLPPKVAFSMLVPLVSGAAMNRASAPWTVAVFTLTLFTNNSALVPSGWLVATRTSIVNPVAQEPPIESAGFNIAPLVGEMNDPEQVV
jgi:hypothetical protein